jgi:hypothetical protein
LPWKSIAAWSLAMSLPSWTKRWRNTVRRSLFATTTVRSLSPKRSAAESKSAGSKQRSFRPAHRGKSPTSRASTVVCAMICSTSRRSVRWSRPNGWPRITAKNTTTSVRIPNWVTRPRRSLRPAVWLRSGLRPPLRQTTKPNPTPNKSLIEPRPQSGGRSTPEEFYPKTL